MKLKQKIICFVLSLCVAVLCIPVTALAENSVPQDYWTNYAASSFAGGTGTQSDPYQIASAEQLALLVKEVNSGVEGSTHVKEYFILTADIDLSGHIWKPLGYQNYGASAQAFMGFFDGNGKKITGLYVDERDKNCSAGLFGNIAAAGTEPAVQNLIVENGTVLAGYSTDMEDVQYGAGILIGSISVLGGSNIPYTVVKNCTVSGNVSSSMYAGGLVGDASYTHFEKCKADVKVNGICVAGGFAGNAFASDLTDCVATGNVKSDGWTTGGFAGVLFYNTKATRCAAYGDVEAKDWNLGGFVGYAEENTIIKNSIAMSDVTSTVTSWDPKAGGFAGTTSARVKLEKCHAAGKITFAGEGSIGGMIASGINSSATGCSFDSTKNASLSALGSEESGTYEITAQDTNGVLANICVDYYGGHDMVEAAAVKPTCTEPGLESGSECSRCGHREGFAEVEATGHKGGTATCSSKAKCEVCDAEYGEFDLKNHSNLKHTDAKAATKDAEGNTEYWYCDGCDKYYSDSAASKEIAKADTVTAKLSETPDGRPESGSKTDNGSNTKPQGTSPKTGDVNGIVLLTAILAFACGGLLIGKAQIKKFFLNK